MQIEVHDNSGKLVSALVTEAKINNIDISHYAAGVYFVKLISNEEINI